MSIYVTDTAKMTCARCGGPVTVGRMSYGMVHPGRDLAIATNRIRLDSVFCSGSCLHRHARELIALERCFVCRKRYSRGQGHDPYFCSQPCADAHEKQLKLAIKELANGAGIPSSLKEAESAFLRARALSRAWSPRSRQIEPPGPPAPIAPTAQSGLALRLRLEALDRKVGALKAEKALTEAHARETKRARDWKEAAIARLEKDKSWKRDLLAQLDEKS